ncbi:VOC family protein [Paenibacillus flagellatus]|uniref:VOC domain-containing protein n=1 Tax=Paenibacillus flagellatus TaxID=2211139 RepID=A0A2V5K6M9_9BACL|nr:VOC family protein [Paenibacillus flagellatus]PYI53433.1 hypothetical protein DLM86_16795 [Paenibacillus flagellatus]
MNKTQIPLHKRIAAVFMHAADLRRSAEWYGELLGWPVAEERLNRGPVYRFELPGTALVLDNGSFDEPDPGKRAAPQPLVMLACDDIDAAYDYIRTKAEPLSEPVRGPGTAFFDFRAPDGRVYRVGRPEDGDDGKPAPDSASPVRPRIGGVFINVRDMKASAAWISELLDVPLRAEETDDSIYVIPNVRGADLMLDDNRARRGETFEIPLMFDCTDIDAAYAHAASRGMSVFQPIERHGDVSFFTLRDPDGNLVMVCQSTEGEIDGYTLVQLPVTDLRRAVAFYTEVLGFVPEHPERPVAEHAFLRTRSGGGPGLHLLEVAESEFKTGHWSHGGKPVHGLELHSRDIRSLHKRLLKAGARIEAEPYFVEPCGRYVKFYDPDGHLLCVNQGM